jgi:two-component system chemotaxis response regulator CheB
MQKRNIIVIGASAGGFEAVKKLVADFPADLPAAVFIVWHMPPDVRGVLPQVLNRENKITAVNAIDGEPIQFNRIYVAPPDRHLLLEKGHVRVTRGPKENRFRPAVDPLFRSAAYIYVSRVIGIVLSGSLDDGTAGLWTIKNRGGIAIVQDPEDAEVPSMPQNALKAVEVDYCVPVSEMSLLITRIVSEDIAEMVEPDMKEDKKTEMELRIAKQEIALELGILHLGDFTPYTCPECHGVLSLIKEGDILRYRCHTGHAYSVDSLLSSITEKIEDTLWDAVRGVEESAILLNELGDYYANKNHPKFAAVYFKKATEAETRAKQIRQVILSHEQLNTHDINSEFSEK